jgi:hypothetical protein
MSLVGDTPPQDVTNCFLEVMADSDCPPVMALLLDTTRSTSLASRTAEEIRFVARFLAPYAERVGGRCAILVTTPMDHDLVRLGSVYTDSIGVETRGFRTEAAALEWLGVNGS